jgi:O-antigen/teichoic acid export membrane protein
MMIRAKVIAVTVGQIGLGIVAQFLTLQSLSAGLGSLGLALGLNRRLSRSSRAASGDRHTTLLVSAGLLTAASLAVSGVIILFDRQLARLLWQVDMPRWFMWVVAAATPLGALLLAAPGVLNGLGFASRALAMSVAGTVLSLVAITTGLWWFDIDHAVVGHALALAVTTLCAVWCLAGPVRVLSRPRVLPSLSEVAVEARELLPISITALFLSVEYQATILFVRTVVFGRLGLASGGLYQALIGLSGVAGFAVQAYTSGYGLHRVVRAGREAFGPVFLRIASVPLVGALLYLVTMFLFSEITIVVLLSPEFAAASRLLPVQALGDVFMTLGYLLGVPLVAFGTKRAWVASGQIFHFAYAGGSVLAIDHWGLEGVAYAYMIAALGYSALGYCLMRRLRLPAFRLSKA